MVLDDSRTSGAPDLKGAFKESWAEKPVNAHPNNIPTQHQARIDIRHIRDWVIMP